MHTSNRIEEEVKKRKMREREREKRVLSCDHDVEYFAEYSSLYGSLGVESIGSAFKRIERKEGLDRKEQNKSLSRRTSLQHKNEHQCHEHVMRENSILVKEKEAKE
jgi:hypothetical protein